MSCGKFFFLRFKKDRFHLEEKGVFVPKDTQKAKAKTEIMGCDGSKEDEVKSPGEKRKSAGRTEEKKEKSFRSQPGAQSVAVGTTSTGSGSGMFPSSSNLFLSPTALETFQSACITSIREIATVFLPHSLPKGFCVDAIVLDTATGLRAKVLGLHPLREAEKVLYLLMEDIGVVPFVPDGMFLLRWRVLSPEETQLLPVGSEFQLIPGHLSMLRDDVGEMLFTGLAGPYVVNVSFLSLLGVQNGTIIKSAKPPLKNNGGKNGTSGSHLQVPGKSSGAAPIVQNYYRILGFQADPCNPLNDPILLVQNVKNSVVGVVDTNHKFIVVAHRPSMKQLGAISASSSLAATPGKEVATVELESSFHCYPSPNGEPGSGSFGLPSRTDKTVSPRSWVPQPVVTPKDHEPFETTPTLDPFFPVPYVDSIVFSEAEEAPISRHNSAIHGTVQPPTSPVAYDPVTFRHQESSAFCTMTRTNRNALQKVEAESKELAKRKDFTAAIHDRLAPYFSDPLGVLQDMHRFICYETPMTSWFPPFRRVCNPAGEELDQIQAMTDDISLRNLFEVGLGGGATNKVNRANWENRLFNSSYAKANPAERVKYGVLNIFNDPEGPYAPSYHYGDVLLVFAGLRHCTTMTPTDSDNCRCTVCPLQCDSMTAVLSQFSAKKGTEELVELGKIASGQKSHSTSKKTLYKEMQIHGSVFFDRHVSHVVIPNHYETCSNEMLVKLLNFCRKNACWLVSTQTMERLAAMRLWSLEQLKEVVVENGIENMLALQLTTVMTGGRPHQLLCGPQTPEQRRYFDAISDYYCMKNMCRLTALALSGQQPPERKIKQKLTPRKLIPDDML